MTSSNQGFLFPCNQPSDYITVAMVSAVWLHHCCYGFSSLITSLLLWFQPCDYINVAMVSAQWLHHRCYGFSSVITSLLLWFQLSDYITVAMVSAQWLHQCCHGFSPMITSVTTYWSDFCSDHQWEAAVHGYRWLFKSSPANSLYTIMQCSFEQV